MAAAAQIAQTDARQKSPSTRGRRRPVGYRGRLLMPTTKDPRLSPFA